MATTTRAKRRKLEALEIEEQQLSEIQNDIIDSQVCIHFNIKILKIEILFIYILFIYILFFI